MARGLLEVRVDGAEAVKVSFDLTNERIKNRVRQAVHDAAKLLKARAVGNLAGHSRTGTLAKNIIDAGRDTDTGIYWKVGTARDGFYGRFLEQGVEGAVDVKEYRRAAKSRAAVDVVGFKAVRAKEIGPLQQRDWVNPKTGMKSIARRRTIVTGKTFKVLKTYAHGFGLVKAHIRNRHTAAHPWLQPALDEVAPGFRAAIAKIAETPEE